MRQENTVELIGMYGSDMTHGLSAWTSTSRDLTDEKRNRLPTLLEMLADNGHHTPYEKSMLHFLVTAEAASHIHILKHRIGVSVNGVQKNQQGFIYLTQIKSLLMFLLTSAASITS